MGSPYAVAAAWIGLAFASALVSTRTGIAVSLVEILVGAPQFFRPRLEDHLDPSAPSQPVTERASSTGTVPE